MTNLNTAPDLHNPDRLFQSVVELLEDEVDRQETALVLCRAQGNALRVQDADFLQAKTAALELVTQEAVDADRARKELVRELGAACGLSSQHPTLGEVARVASEPWRARLLELRARLRQVLAETRGVVRANAVLLRTSMNVIQGAMGALEEAVSTPSAVYTSEGAEPTESPTRPTLIDQKG